MPLHVESWRCFSCDLRVFLCVQLHIRQNCEFDSNPMTEEKKKTKQNFLILRNTKNRSENHHIDIKRKYINYVTLHMRSNLNSLFKLNGNAIYWVHINGSSVVCIVSNELQINWIKLIKEHSHQCQHSSETDDYVVESCKLKWIEMKIAVATVDRDEDTKINDFLLEQMTNGVNGMEKQSVCTFLKHFKFIWKSNTQVISCSKLIVEKKNLLVNWNVKKSLIQNNRQLNSSNSHTIEYC